MSIYYLNLLLSPLYLRLLVLTIIIFDYYRCHIIDMLLCPAATIIDVTFTHILLDFIHTQVHARTWSQFEFTVWLCAVVFFFVLLIRVHLVEKCGGFARPDNTIYVPITMCCSDGISSSLFEAIYLFGGDEDDDIEYRHTNIFTPFTSLYPLQLFPFYISTTQWYDPLVYVCATAAAVTSTFSFSRCCFFFSCFYFLCAIATKLNCM